MIRDIITTHENPDHGGMLCTGDESEGGVETYYRIGTTGILTKVRTDFRKRFFYESSL